MRGLNTEEVLSIWERALHEASHRRAIMLLAAVCSEETVQDLSRLPLGERDARLLELRELTFGPLISSLTACPACGDQVQADFSTREVGSRRQTSDGPATFSHEGITTRFRPPDTLDLETVANLSDEELAQRELLARCLIEPRLADGTPPDLAEIPRSFVRAFAERVSSSDPLADISLALECPQCGHRWNAPFDIGGFFWLELQAYAQRTLGEVHEIARAYGWSEEEVLSLTPVRRNAFLELIRK